MKALRAVVSVLFGLQLAISAHATTTTRLTSDSTTSTTVSFCGNGALEGPEQCDDGNALDGDCCSAACTFEAFGSACAHPLTGPCVPNSFGQCDGGGACLSEPGNADVDCGAFGFGVRFSIRDESGTSRDRLKWRLRPGRWAKYNSSWIPAFGDPTEDTTYTFCVYEMHETFHLVRSVRYGRVFTVGAPWEPTTGGWVYRASSAAGEPQGEVLVKIANHARLQVSASMAGLPGPVSSTEYFHALGVALIGSKGRCFLHRAGGSWWTPSWNAPTGYRFGARPYIND